MCTNAFFFLPLGLCKNMKHKKVTVITRSSFLNWRLNENVKSKKPFMVLTLFFVME